MKLLINSLVLGLASSCKQTSKTAMVNEQVAVLPLASVAVQVTVVVPTGMMVPEAGTHATVTPGQLSLAVGGGKSTTVAKVAGQVNAVTAVTLSGQSIVGGWVSFTVTVNWHETIVPPSTTFG